MTVKELIDLLATLPQDAQVVMPHFWDADLTQADLVDAADINLVTGKAKSSQTFDLGANCDGVPLVMIS